MIKPTATPATAAELEANIRQSRAIRAGYLRAMRYNLRAARAALHAATTPELVRSYVHAAELALAELTEARRADPKVRALRTAGAACAAADRLERTIEATDRHGHGAYYAASTPAYYARCRALAADLRAHARDLPARP